MAPVKETSGFTVGLIVSYVRDEAGDDGVRELIAGSGIGATERQLADARRWWSYADKVALFEAAEAVVGDPEVATRIGRTVLAASVAPAMVPLLRAFGGPSPLLRNVAKAASRFSTAATMEALEIGRTNATLTYRLLPPPHPEPPRLWLHRRPAEPGAPPVRPPRGHRRPPLLPGARCRPLHLPRDVAA